MDVLMDTNNRLSDFELLPATSSTLTGEFCTEIEAILIPGLSNDVAKLCLAKVARITLPKLSFVCRAWKYLCYSNDFINLRIKIGSAEAWLYVLTEKPNGSPFKAFSPQLDKWFELPHILRPSTESCLQGFTCVALDAKLLLMGGMYPTFDKIRQEYTQVGVVSGDVQIYNACANQWSKAQSMKTPRSWFAAAVIGHHVYVAGGQGKDRFLNSVEVYDSQRDTWLDASSMNCVRSSCYGLALHGKFWVIGGELMRNQYGERLERSSAEVYDPETGIWTMIPEMWLDTQKVPGPSTVHCGKMLFAHKNKLMVYDDDANFWYHVGYLSGVDMFNDRFLRFGFACESMDGELYIVGGLRVSKQDRRIVQSLNSTEVSKAMFLGPSKRTVWRNVANLGANEGNVLASAVIRL